MGKGAMSHGGAGEAKDGEEENMAAWLLGINTLKIQPFKLPPPGITFHTLFLCFFGLHSFNLIKLLTTLMFDSF